MRLYAPARGWRHEGSQLKPQGPLVRVPLAIWHKATARTRILLCSRIPRRGGINPWILQHDPCFFSRNMAAIKSVNRVWRVFLQRNSFLFLPRRWSFAPKFRRTAVPVNEKRSFSTSIIHFSLFILHYSFFIPSFKSRLGCLLFVHFSLFTII